MSSVERASPGNLDSDNDWSPAEISELRHSLGQGFSVQEAADFLGRNVAEVIGKAVELGFISRKISDAVTFAGARLGNKQPPALTELAENVVNQEAEAA
jgi:hypothetical protein